MHLVRVVLECGAEASPGTNHASRLLLGIFTVVFSLELEFCPLSVDNKCKDVEVRCK